VRPGAEAIVTGSVLCVRSALVMMSGFLGIRHFAHQHFAARKEQDEYRDDAKSG
jgi:hypothetical protein